jgi:hypothetical protein
MTPYELTSTIVAIIALVISVIALVKGSKSSQFALEMSVHQNIVATKERVVDRLNDLSRMAVRENRTEEEQSLCKILTQSHRVALENNLNAYDDACEKYLSKKIGKKWFKSQYQREIRSLVNDKNYTEFFDATKSPFRNILKLYNEWENHD